MLNQNFTFFVLHFTAYKLIPSLFMCLSRQYNAFREKRKEEGYSEEDLKESYGFLLFDDVNKVNI